MRNATTAATRLREPAAAAAAIAAAAHDHDVRAALVTCVVDVDVPRFARELARLLPGAAIVGTTVCQRAATESGGDFTAAALFLGGDGFRVGVAAGEGPDRMALGKRIAMDALRTGGFDAGSARFAILHATPGTETPVLAGLSDVLGTQTPIIGGSPADNDISGRWAAFAGDVVVARGACVLVSQWPGKIGVTYQSGYMATACRGVVTRANGRMIHEIDGQPAAAVYERWLGQTLPVDQNVLGVTTLRPLGVVRGNAAGVDLHVLVHPERIGRDGSIATFAEVERGETIVMMESSRASLLRRGATVARFAATTAGIKPEEVVGEYLVYCAGCSLALGEEVDAMVATTAKEVRAPFLMPFTFGEQGRITRGRADHGNLMCSALVLGR